MVEEQACTQSQELEAAGLQLEVIRDLDGFQSMCMEWERLVERAGANPVFLSHSWLSTWWEAFGEGRQLHIVAVRAGGELVAAAPMLQTSRRRYGLKLQSIEGIYNPHTPRYDFIVAKGYGNAVYRQLWNTLSEDAGTDTVVLQHLLSDSSTLASMPELAEADGWLVGEWLGEPSPYIRLACDYETFLSTLKSGDRYNLRKRFERLSKLGPIDVEVISDKAGVRDALQDGLRIEAAAWKGTEGTAILSDPAATEFYTKLAEREADLGRLRLTFLRVGGKRISFSYIIKNNKTLYGLKIGYDPEYHSYSPGNTLLNLVLEEACAQGIEEYDFLGGNDQWKYDWTKDAREYRWLFLFRNRLRSRAAHYMKFSVAPKAKKILSGNAFERLRPLRSA